MEPTIYKESRLPNGLRIGTACLSGRNSAAIGIWTGSGSRHEPEHLNGVAHLVEHMVFKGTQRRSARRISLDIEGVGGEINAFTSEDHTCYHAVVPAKRLPDAADVLADIFCHSKFSARDFAREKQVILEEIQMYRENPGQHVDDMLSAVLWRDHPLGRLITGTPKSLAGIDANHLGEWTSATHVACNTLVSVASPWAHEQVVALLSPLLGHLPTGKLPVAQAFKATTQAPKVYSDTRDIEQTHVSLGFRTPGRSHRLRFALRLLSVLLGETMGSRLFHSLREKRGLCYSVQSETDVFAETGLLEIYTAVENSRLEAAIRALGKELKLLLEKSPDGRELTRAKEYTLGQQELWFESTTNQMNWVAESLLFHGTLQPISKAMEKIKAVTSSDIGEIANAVIKPRRAAAAIIGPAAAEAAFFDWLGL